MSERTFLFIVGSCILAGLYFEIGIMIYLLSLFLFIEGVTDLRLTTLSQNLLGKTVPAGVTVFQTHQRFSFDAFRAWRIMAAIMLGGSFLLLNEHNIEIVWFIPWFMGFAITGAGVSGVCPMILFIRWIGFR